MTCSPRLSRFVRVAVLRRAGYLESDRLGTGRDQQRIVCNAAAVHELQRPGLGVESGYGYTKLHVDAVLKLERRWPQRVRRCVRGTRKETLGKLGRSHGPDASALNSVMRPE